MKKIFYLLALLPMAIVGQTQTENYIKTTYFKKPTSQGSVNPNSPTDASIKVTYYDGLGRPIQEVVHKQSGTGNDFVNHIQYDGFGRQVKEFLPIVSSQSLNYRIIDSTSVSTYYSTQSFPTMITTGTPFSEKMIEKSPLNRVLKQTAPGDDWAMDSGHEIRFEYKSNNSSDAVIMYNVNTSWNPTLELYDISPVNEGFYGDNQLFITITKDENWISGKLNSVEEFKDKEGRVILKRCYSTDSLGADVRNDTYYVYDIYGNLTYVIPPAVLNINDANVVREFCYQYKYDSRNRLVEKKLPGKTWEYIVYDNLDRVVMTGPAKPPFRHLSNEGWMLTKYDSFNRTIMTGWMTSPSNFDSLLRKNKQVERNSQTIFSESRSTSGTPTTLPSSANNPAHSYTNVSLPTSGYYILVVNYFDDYGYLDAPSSPFADVETQPVYYNNIVKPKGLLTGKWIKILDLTLSSASTKRETSYILYDYKARPIRNYVKNYESSPGWTQTDTKLDFEGKVEYTVVSHRRTANPSSNEIVTLRDFYTYTDQSRLLSHTQKINLGAIQLINENSYDDLGNLICKNVGNTSSTPLQRINYSYNIRGWLTGINNDPTDNLVLNTSENDLFSFKINYNNVQNAVNYIGKTLYNGNISETYWKSSSDNILRKYGYQYDGMNRLTVATYLKPGSSQAEPGTYNESVSYDMNGNILTLKRNGGDDGVMPEQEIDNLTYSYANNNNSNTLVKVSDNYSNPASGFIDGVNTGDDYTYDSHGNMTQDLNKGITNIRYNHLNLPMEITFANSNKISYVYDGNGKKVEKNVTEGTILTTTKYFEGFQYLKVGSSSETLQLFPTSEGYVSKTSNKYNYIFNYVDHLGNVRLSYSDLDKDGVLETNEEIIDCSGGGGNCISYYTSCILKENNYYPFGLLQEGYSQNESQQVDYKYKYNGKELQNELGLNLYDYGARNYDPALGRWINIDPLAEKYESISPYVYAGNIPTRFVDFDGNDFGIHFDFENGTITITQTFYTDGNEKSNRLAKETSEYLNSLSGTFGFKTKKNGTFVINFVTKVVEGESEEDGREKALNDNEGNFFNIDESNKGPALIYDPFSGRAAKAVTEEGGDWTIFTDNESVTGRTFKHENLHGFGASHKAIGGSGDNSCSMNERVIGAIFKIASNQVKNLSLKAKNYKKGDALSDIRGFSPYDIPKVKAYSKNGQDVKLSGTIIKLTK